MKLQLTVVIVARNESKMIKECLESLHGLNCEVTVVDMDSGDDTVKIAGDTKARIINYPWSGFDYASPRNMAARKVSTPWIFYLDADERMTPDLEKEIKKIIGDTSNKYSAWAFPRRNIILGKELKHGGQWPDYVIRLFKRADFIGWEGEVHEQARYKGLLGYLKNPLIHQKHETIAEMVDKTNNWSEIEAELLFKSKHPRMVWWRFIRIMFTEFFERVVIKMAFLDGIYGMIYAYYQVWSRFLTYAKLWEKQR